jgi:serine protease
LREFSNTQLEVSILGYDFVQHLLSAGDGDGIDPNPDGSGLATSSFYGTHVAGTVAAKFNNTTGLAGVA